jgi:dephospho-CoA kinase
MYAEGGAAVAPIAETFPGVVKDGAVDRAALAGIVLADPDKLKALEAVVHPLVGADQAAFMAEAAAAQAPAVVLDIPLLFENNSEAFFDAVVVVSAPADVQRQRVLQRAGMTAEKLEAILAQQTPDAEKRARADFVISTDQPFEAMARDIRDAYEAILEKGPRLAS